MQKTLLLSLLLCAVAHAQAPVWLETLDLKGVTQGRGQARPNRSVEGKPLSVGGHVFAHGVGTNANSSFTIDLKGTAHRFEAQVGVDDAVKKAGSVVFRVLVDGQERYNSGRMRGGDPARSVKVDLTGARRLQLLVDNDGAEIYLDQADWLMARIFADTPPQAVVLPPAAAVRRTPPTAPTPRVCGPQAFSARPRAPFMHTLRATGKGPITFAAEGLPAGLQLDPASGCITGTLAQTGDWDIQVSARNALGGSRAPLHIVCGPTLGLTPPMGWNSWNCWGSSVDDAKIREAADKLVSTGLASHGWTYINIDDGWSQGRDAQGNILPNSKFPDMAALAAYVHGKGLKFGIYSSPGPKTCAGFVGSLEHEAQDAQTYASWGVDYLKYDWCSCMNPDTRAPFRIMHEALAAQPRDILYSICQYGRDKVWTWGAQTGGQLWRTTGDIDDVWGSMSDIGFNQNGLESFAGPGHFNDADMLVIGTLGWGPELRPTRLDPNEQYTHVTLWSLLASPLMIGSALNRLDDFSMGLLTNDEVIDINQDVAGRQGWRLSQSGETEVWGRPLNDGSWAVGFFNRGVTPADVTLETALLKLSGNLRMRDVWRQKDLGEAVATFDITVAPHGAELLRIWAAP